MTNHLSNDRDFEALEHTTQNLIDGALTLKNLTLRLQCISLLLFMLTAFSAVYINLSPSLTSLVFELPAFIILG
jgi:hypothetical protein